MTANIETRLEDMLGRDRELAQSNTIHRDDAGDYHVFGRWCLRNQNDLVAVIDRGEKIAEFSDLRIAVSWCIAEKYQEYELAQNISRLDHDIKRWQPTEDAYRWICRAFKDPDRRQVAMTKRHETRIRYESAIERMRRYVSRAKYLQTRGFNDEIARTRRPAPHNTGRDGSRKSSRTSR